MADERSEIKTRATNAPDKRTSLSVSIIPINMTIIPPAIKLSSNKKEEKLQEPANADTSIGKRSRQNRIMISRKPIHVRHNPLSYTVKRPVGRPGKRASDELYPAFIGSLKYGEQALAWKCARLQILSNNRTSISPEELQCRTDLQPVKPMLFNGTGWVDTSVERAE